MLGLNAPGGRRLGIGGLVSDDAAGVGVSVGSSLMGSRLIDSLLNVMAANDAGKGGLREAWASLSLSHLTCCNIARWASLVASLSCLICFNARKVPCLYFHLSWYFL